VLNKQKLLTGYVVLVSALLLTVIIRILTIMRAFKLSKELGFEIDIKCSDQLSTVIWGSIPYIVMSIDLIWQQVIFKKKHIKSINIDSITVVSTIGVVLYFFNNTFIADPFVRPLGNIAIPILQLVAYSIARLSNRINEI
jgi:hypothetical protein